SADARRLQSRRAAAARLCVQPFYFLPTGLMLPEPAGGDPRILLDGGNAPSPDVERRAAAAITPNAAARRRGRRTETAHGGSRARWGRRVAHPGRPAVTPSGVPMM